MDFKSDSIPINSYYSHDSEDSLTFSVHDVTSLYFPTNLSNNDIFDLVTKQITHEKKFASSILKKDFFGLGSLRDSSLNHDSSPDDKYANKRADSIIEAIYDAYVNHQNISLCPSDFIIMIGQGISAHINKLPEKLRHVLVEHQGKQTISVFDEKISIDKKSDWSGLFSKFAEEVRKRIKKDLYPIIVDDTSTATQTTRIVSEINLLDCVKNFFKFEAGGGCGFPMIKLRGTPEDWKKLQSKVYSLRDMNKNDVLHLDWWLKNLIPVVDKICKAGIDREIDRAFWGNICKDSEVYGTFLNGWINAFLPYGYSEQVGFVCNSALKSELHKNFVFDSGISVDRLKMALTKIPFTFLDISTNKTYNMHVYSGFLGSKSKGSFLELSYFWCVYRENVILVLEDLVKIAKKEEKKVNNISQPNKAIVKPNIIPIKTNLVVPIKNKSYTERSSSLYADLSQKKELIKNAPKKEIWKPSGKSSK